MNASPPDYTFLFIVAGLGYLLGSIPFGLVLTRIFGLGDIRAIGSGNIGATNVLRTGNKPLALATLILDSSKGAIAVLAFAHLIAPNAPAAALIAGIAAVFGHNFPLWLMFKGGKGVATTLGVLLALWWPLGIAACVTWLLTAVLFRYSSLAALFALGLSPVYAWVMGTPQLTAGASVLALLAVLRHRQNIRRLLRGEEPKIGKK